jgi:Putative serine esterase (DUF676)
LGGLLARYVVGCVSSSSLSFFSDAHAPTRAVCSILYQRDFFSTVTPVNFNTIATPHIGLIRYPSFVSRLSAFIVPRFLSRTGEQFYGVDKWSKSRKALLEFMADPGKELCLHSHRPTDPPPRARVLSRSQTVSSYSNLRKCVSSSHHRSPLAN